jgi:hypothetical protein
LFFAQFAKMIHFCNFFGIDFMTFTLSACNTDIKEISQAWANILHIYQPPTQTLLLAG